VVIGIPKRKIDNIEPPKNTPKNEGLTGQKPRFIFKKPENSRFIFKKLEVKNA
jgi:hypothetical protein